MEFVNLDILYKILLSIFVIIAFVLIKKVIVKFIFNQINKHILNKVKSKVIFDAFTTPFNVLFFASSIFIAYQISPLEYYNIEFIYKIFHSIVLFCIFLFLSNLSYLFAEGLSVFVSKTNAKIRKDIVKFVETFIRIFIILSAFMVIFQEWGYNLSTFVASLGIGGLAFALAAKDTLANIFGYIIVFTEAPFEIGDWVKIGDTEGDVEEITIRSTKIRTFNQSLINLPNYLLTTSSIENFSKRAKRRIKMNVALTYDTTSKDIQNIISQIRDMLKHHNDIDNDVIYVYLNEFADSSLDIFCYFFTKSTNWNDYLKAREDVYFKIMDIVQNNNSSFAFPSQSVYLQK